VRVGATAQRQLTMLFNSYEFIFAFLPAAAAVFYVLGRASRAAALSWLIAVSLFFYAWWRPLNLLLLSPSILINLLLARSLRRLGETPGRERAANLVLAAGVAFNLAFLGYFKYRNFFLEGVNDAFGTAFVLTNLILPLGISFITFQKIAFLVDVHARLVTSFTVRDYCLFVLFFPQLIAGPIVHYRELMPQFHKADCRFNATDVSVGLTLFFLGLFKKVVLADGIAPLVSSIYEAAAGGDSIALVPAWLAAVGFTLQIYFDFSGYSDMAIGAARLFGVRLPPNFDSPLRATNIIDFWLRWHITLTRFLTAYVYNPLLLTLTRRRLARGLSPVGGRNTTVGAFLSLLVFPTMLTMLLSGLWHGAGYLFLFWGALHGVYLSINHAWRMFGPRTRPAGPAAAMAGSLAGLSITLAAVVVGMVFFRAASWAAATDIVSGMAATNGIVGAVLSQRDIVVLTRWVAVLLFIALAMPNTLRLLERFEPALGFTPRADGPIVDLAPKWRPSPAWAVVLAAVAVAAIMRLSGPSEFLYWQF
jgi:D-alanyl-lipoteichoic acid acyltransferase DltB (MBOAT superfamily)